jgi:hypothetical protein
MRYIGYLTRCFFVPRLNISTSGLFRGIISFGPPGAGLAVLERGAEWMRGGGAVEIEDFGFEMIELVKSDGFGAGRVADNGGDVDEGFGRGLADEEAAGLLERCREDEDNAWGRRSLRSSNKSSTSSMSSSSSSSDELTKVSFRPPAASVFEPPPPDVKALSRASLSSNDGPLMPVIPPENFPTGFCFRDNILKAGWAAF